MPQISLEREEEEDEETQKFHATSGTKTLFIAVHIQRCEKRLVNLVKQDPGRVRQNS